MPQTKKISGYNFEFVENISPILEDGKLKVFLPQSRYRKRNLVGLHQYGEGEFCSFRIDKRWGGKSGVYLLFSAETLVYIGECIDLAKRFNAGYGTISPRNCYTGGQQTNCRINKIIRAEIQGGSQISLYFYSTSDYKYVEKELIEERRPKYNIKS